MNKEVNLMEVFGMVGFVFGLLAFTNVSTNSKKIKELEKRISDLER